MNRRRLVPLLSGAFAIGIALLLVLGIGGWLMIAISTPLFAFAWVSIKTAFLASDIHIAELTGDTAISKETAEKLADRL